MKKNVRRKTVTTGDLLVAITALDAKVTGLDTKFTGAIGSLDAKFTDFQGLVERRHDELSQAIVDLHSFTESSLTSLEKRIDEKMMRRFDRLDVRFDDIDRRFDSLRVVSER